MKSHPVRVAYVTHHQGIHDERFLRSLRARKDVDVTAIVFRPTVPEELREIPGLRLYTIYSRLFPFDDPHRTSYSWQTRLRIRLGEFYFARKLREIFAENRIDVVHSGWIQSDSYVASKTGFHPIIVMPVGSDILLNPNRDQATRQRTKWVIENSDYIVCDCLTVRDRVREIASTYAPDRFFLLPCGINVDRFTPNPEGLSISPIRLIMTRNFFPVYNIPFFLKVLHILKDLRPTLEATIIGEGPERPVIERMISDLNLSPTVKLLGHLPNDDLVRHLRESTLYVSTSVSDGTSVSLLEAMGCGLPCAVSDIPSNREWVKEGVNGVLLDLDNAEVSARKISKMLDSPEVMHAFGRHSRALIEEHADWDKNVDSLVDLYRKLAGKNGHTGLPYQQCVSCVMDSGDDPGIRFDSAGVCNLCAAWKERAALVTLPEEMKAAKLRKIVEEIKANGRGRPYDCILGVSGGVDSTYLALQAKKLGLRCLAVHFDNGWNSELAVKNIENILHSLGFDLFTYVVDWEEFKDLQLAYLKASVIDIEIPTDHGFVAALYDVARKKSVKHIVTGINIATEGPLPKSWIWAKMDVMNLRAIHRQFGTQRLRTFPTLGFLRGVFYEKFLGMSVTHLLNFLPYDKEVAKRSVMEELGWRDYGGKHYESIFTRFYQGYILPTKFGVYKQKAHLSTLISSGQITREQALLELQKPAYDPDTLRSDREFVIKKFGLDEKSFEEIMQLPIRSHLDFASYVTSVYPLHEQFFKAIRPLTRILKKCRPNPS